MEKIDEYMKMKYKSFKWYIEVQMLEDAVKDQICRDYYSDSTKADISLNSNDRSPMSG